MFSLKSCFECYSTDMLFPQRKQYNISKKMIVFKGNICVHLFVHPKRRLENVNTNCGGRELSKCVCVCGVQSLSHVQLFTTPWTAAHQASLSFTISQSLLKLMSISSSIIPFFSCPQVFPASGSFPMSWLFASGGQSIGASALASGLPMNIQG